MSHRAEQKEARRAERMRAEEAARRAEARQRLIRRAGYGAVALIAATLVTLAITLGGDGAPAAPAGGTARADVGAKAPEFTLTDAVSGKLVTRSSLRGRKTMLFFSEGVNCQACMVQAADLEKAGTLDKRGIQLVSVTTDHPGDLSRAAKQYGIRTPILADPTGAMSSAYGMLGHGGMGHPTVNGHAFMLLDEQGTIRWHQAYQEMYVKPDQLLRDLKAAT